MSDNFFSKPKNFEDAEAWRFWLQETMGATLLCYRHETQLGVRAAFDSMKRDVRGRHAYFAPQPNDGLEMLLRRVSPGHHRRHTEHAATCVAGFLTGSAEAIPTYESYLVAMSGETFLERPRRSESWLLDFHIGRMGFDSQGDIFHASFEFLPELSTTLRVFPNGPIELADVRDFAPKTVHRETLVDAWMRMGLVFNPDDPFLGVDRSRHEQLERYQESKALALNWFERQHVLEERKRYRTNPLRL